MTNSKTWRDEHDSYGGVFLQLHSVETGNVWTAMPSTVWIKKHVKPNKDSAVKTSKDMITHLFKPRQIIVCVLAAKGVVKTTVSVRLGDAKSSNAWLLLNISSLYSLYEGIQSITPLNTVN